MKEVASIKLLLNLSRYAPLMLLCTIGFACLALGRLAPAANWWLLERLNVGFEGIAALAFVTAAAYWGTRLGVYAAHDVRIVSSNDVKVMIGEGSDLLENLREMREIIERLSKPPITFDCGDLTLNEEQMLIASMGGPIFPVSKPVAPEMLQKKIDEFMAAAEQYRRSVDELLRNPQTDTAAGSPPSPGQSAGTGAG